MASRNRVELDKNTALFTWSDKGSIVYSFKYRRDEVTSNQLYEGYFAGGGLPTGRYYVGEVDAVASKTDGLWLLRVEWASGTRISDGPAAGPCSDYNESSVNFGVENLRNKQKVRGRLKEKLKREVERMNGTGFFGPKQQNISEQIRQLP